MLWHPVGGARIRGAKLLLRALDETVVDLVVVAPPADVARDRSKIPDLPRLRTYVFSDESQPGWAPARASRQANSLIRRLSTNGGAYDAVHVECHYTLPVVPDELLPRTVVVEHNIESQLLEQRAQLGQLVTPAEIRDLREREQRAWSEAGAIIALSPEDASEIRSREPAITPHMIPNGWDHLPVPDRPATDGCGPLSAPRLLFVADYDYPPNRDALVWLVTDVFPRIRAGVGGAILVVAGINLPQDLAAVANSYPGIVVQGYVPDLGAELDQSDIVLCPLRIGGGVKVKVIEAIRRACLLVSTTVGGIEGIPAPLRPAICFADDAETFAGHVVRLCTDPGERRRRREQLLANQWAVPTWEDSAVRTMEVWTRVSANADRSSGRSGRSPFHPRPT